MKQQNNVTLLGYYGSDEVNAQAAWCSTDRELTQDKKDRLPQFLKQLVDAGHTNIFEKSFLHFLIEAETASHIHLIRHRLISPNVESARYKELKQDKYTIPDDWNDITIPNETQDKILDFAPYATDTNWSDMLEWYTQLGNVLYHNCVSDLTQTLGRKRAKESARYFKTYNSQVTMDMSMNFRTFVGFQKLRNSEHAQKEIREIAQQMLELVRATGHFKYTLEAFGYGS